MSLMSPKTRKWPKLKPGQQIRIRHTPSGKFVYKPKGHGESRLIEDNCTTWNSFNGPSKFINDQLRFNTPKLPGDYSTSISCKSLGSAEDFCIEIIEMKVVDVINCENIINKQREIEMRKLEDSFYIRYRSTSQLFKNKIFTVDIVQKLINDYPGLQRYRIKNERYDNLYLHKEDISDFVEWIETKMIEVLL